jgi:hypothetical protein
MKGETSTELSCGVRLFGHFLVTFSDLHLATLRRLPDREPHLAIRTVLSSPLQRNRNRENFFWSYDIQQNDTQHNDTHPNANQHNDTKNNNTQQNDIQQNDIQKMTFRK